MTQANFETIAKEAEAFAKQNTRFDIGAFAAQAVLGAVLGFGPPDGRDTSAWKETAMPDEWLGAVASLPGISREGLELLARAMSKKGWVSVQDAMDFVQQEQDLTQLAQEDQGAPGRRQGAGAALLLARAEKELPGTIQRFAENASEFAAAAHGVLSFAYEKTVWAGKALGLVAGVMRDLRRR